MKESLPFIKTVLTYAALGLLLLAYSISVFKKIKIRYLQKKKKKGVIDQTEFIQEELEDRIVGNGILRRKWYGNENDQEENTQEYFEKLCASIVEQKDSLQLQYTPFFKFDERNNIQRFFLMKKRNDLLDELFSFWQKSYRNSSVSLLMIFYVVSMEFENWQKFLSEVLTWMQLPTIDRFILEFLFQDVLQEEMAWQYLYNKRTFIHNPSLRFNIELLLSERKWTKENFPAWPFYMGDGEQAQIENVSFGQLFDFVKVSLQKKCNGFFYRELYNRYANKNQQLIEKIFEKGKYSALKNLADVPDWAEYFWNPAKKFPNGQVDIHEFFRLQKQMKDIPFANHHLLFLLYRIAPLHPLLQKIDLDISFWAKQETSSGTGYKKNISFFLIFVEYLYALQKNQMSLADKMRPFVNETDKKNIIFVSRALSAGGQKQRALEVIDKALKVHPNDKQLLYESIVCTRHNQNNGNSKVNLSPLP